MRRNSGGDERFHLGASGPSGVKITEVMPADVRSAAWRAGSGPGST